MATLALTLGAAALLPTGASALLTGVITGVGVALGSYIDQNYILPTLFPPEDIEGPRLTELRLTFADEGAPHNIGFGNEVRTTSTIIWTSDLLEVVVDEDAGGGKGGGKAGGSIISYEYYLDIAMAYAYTGGAPTDLLEIIANGKTFWRKAVAPVAVTGPGIDANVPVVISGQAIWDLLYTHPPGYAGTDFGDFVPGSEATVAGFANPQNNGTFWVVASSVNAVTNTSRLRLFNPSGVAESPGPAGVSVTQTAPEFKNGAVDEVHLFPGDTTQPPSSVIEGYEGVGNVPAWRGFAYVVLERLFLNEFGATAPVFNMRWVPGDGPAVSDTIDRIMQLAEIVPQQMTVDASACSMPIRGYPTTGPADVVKMLQPLMIAYDIIPQTTQTGLRFFPKREATIIDIDPADLSAHESTGDSKERPLEVGDPTDVELPARISVKYVDHETNHQPGTQDERARIGGASKSTSVINLPLVLEGAGSEARAIAKRILYESFVSRQPVKLSLPMKYSHVQENDLIRVPATLGQTWLLLVQKIDRGDNYLLQLETNLEVLSVLLQDGVHEFPSGTIPGDSQFGGGTLPFPDDNAGTPGPGPTPGGPPRIIVPFILWDRDQPFKGVVGWVKPKDASSEEYEQAFTITAPAHGGFTLSPLENTGSDPYFLDNKTLRVEMLDGELANAPSQAAVLNGENVALIYDPRTGVGEVITWNTAAQVADDHSKIYDISGFYRGRGGTKPEIHAAGAQFLLLSGPGIQAATFDIPSTWIGETRSFLGLPPGESPNDPDHPGKWDGFERDFEITAGMIKPYTLADFAYNRTAAGDTTMRWQYRSLGPSRVFGAAGAPLTAPTELYEIDVFEKGGTEVLATYTVANEHLFTIPADDINTLVGSPTEAFDVRIYQVNTLLGGPTGGRGYDRGVIEIETPGSGDGRWSY